MSNNGQAKTFIEGGATASIQSRSDEKPALLGSDFGFMPFSVGGSDYLDELPVWGSRERDVVLRKFMLEGPTIGRAIIYGQSAKIKNMPWLVESESDVLIAFYTRMLQNSDFGQGVAITMQRLALDYLTQDNGMFMELIPSQGRTFGHSRVEGVENASVAGAIKKTDIANFAHLDSERCWRTYNPEFPVVYFDPYTFKRYLLHYTRVAFTAQMQIPVELARGKGLCALSRAYPALRLIQDLDVFYHEKLTGNGPEIFVVNGMSTNQIENKLIESRQYRLDKGMVRFKDPVIIGSNISAPGALQAQIQKFGLRDVPDGFDMESFMRNAVSQAAMAFGETPRSIGWPGMTAGETKADAEVSERGATRKGHEDFLRTFEWILNNRVLVKSTFRFDEMSDTEDRNRSEINALNVTNAMNLVATGILTPQEARSELIRKGVIEPETIELPEMAMANETTEAKADVKKKPVRSLTT